MEKKSREQWTFAMCNEVNVLVFLAECDICALEATLGPRRSLPSNLMGGQFKRIDKKAPFSDNTLSHNAPLEATAAAHWC